MSTRAIISAPGQGVNCAPSRTSSAPDNRTQTVTMDLRPDLVPIVRHLPSRPQCRRTSTASLPRPIFTRRSTGSAPLVHPRDYVQIRGADPYVVPAGKVLVVTGLGNNAGAIAGVLQVNGVDEIVLNQGNGLAHDMSVVALPPGFSVPAGATVQLLDSSNTPAQFMRAWGYLASQ